jgi:metal-responsive CopG/Arc/MetJ family transcriptional regulator
MARVQVLVQLDDELLSLLDERAAASGVSRSEMVRRGVRAVLAADAEPKLDQAIAEGYRRLPAGPPGALVESLATASIEEEPW